ncbi:Hypothetical predicted protein [Paramuricea clavata]|uniref:Uncharacterized protein n=1 Tax=Paramuricea clavata TaxID=317549 RepID=A0A7D9I9W8_PARCT|nr:Hypothetical predicted protein [Paramuricea clavata]
MKWLPSILETNVWRSNYVNFGTSKQSGFPHQKRAYKINSKMMLTSQMANYEVKLPGKPSHDTPPDNYQLCRQCLGFLFDDIIKLVSELPSSKQSILKIIANMFNLLGVLTPVFTEMKVLFQELCESKLGWDEPLSELLYHKWQRCCNELNKTSIPRLELLSALILARLMAKVTSALQSVIGIDIIKCRTDSITALFWIQGKEKEWKTFVENRINEIRSLVPVECWFHTPGRDNPADIPSWGAKASQLQTSDTWFHGPSWLVCDEGEWPASKPLSQPSDKCNQELKLN